MGRGRGRKRGREHRARARAKSRARARSNRKRRGSLCKVVLNIKIIKKNNTSLTGCGFAPRVLLDEVGIG
jgi:hypothetical protein